MRWLPKFRSGQIERLKREIVGLKRTIMFESDLPNEVRSLKQEINGIGRLIVSTFMEMQHNRTFPTDLVDRVAPLARFIGSLPTILDAGI